MADRAIDLLGELPGSLLRNMVDRAAKILVFNMVFDLLLFGSVVLFRDQVRWIARA